METVALWLVVEAMWLSDTDGLKLVSAPWLTYRRRLYVVGYMASYTEP